MDKQLYNYLFELRAGIRQENLFADGGMPTVCTDDALTDMATLVPETMETLCSISGLGSQFKQAYADRFLAAIAEYRAGNATVKETEEKNDDATKKTIRDLARRLSNLTKKNPMLRQISISGEMNKYYDLVNAGITPGFLLGKSKITLCDRMASDEEKKIFDDLVDIQNIIKRAQRDVGQNETYIAYPYVRGNIRDVDFTIRAPMALFPVNLIKEKSKMILTMDPNRDIVINNSLITLFENVIDSFSDKVELAVEPNAPATLVNDFIAAYKQYGIEIVNETETDDLIPFKEYGADDYITDREGLEVTYTMVLGRFSNESSAIQRDMQIMSSVESLPKTVKELVANVGMKDFYFDVESTDDANKKDCREENLHYINSLNSAQEEILGDLNDENTMIIQGPPGTGKSQVISSAIACAALEGKTVLVLTEKKVARDVLCSRLGSASRYALSIDNSQDKTTFYAQIEKFMENQKLPEYKDDAALSQEIQRRIDSFDEVKEKIYSKMPGFEVEPFRLYMKGKWFDLSDAGCVEELRRIRGCVTPATLTHPYDEIMIASRNLTSESLVEICYSYFKGKESRGMLALLKPGLSENDLFDIATDLAEVVRLENEMNSAGLLAKGKARKAFDAARSSFAAKYLATEPSSYGALQEAVKDPKFIHTYHTYLVNESTYNNLSKAEQDFAESMYNVSCGKIEMASKANEETLNYILYYHINEFDASSLHVRALMEKYDSSMTEIDNFMKDKMEIVRANAEAKIGASIEALRKSKSATNIRGVIDAEHRPNLNKFMTKNMDAMLDCVKIWLMSPDTVSELLPMTRGLFDYLVIDEASQMRVESALPAIYRAKKVIISGDHKQMRPSPRVGSSSVTYTENLDDIEQDVDAVLEQESLLDLARIRYETYFLNFHYRSKYEELIAFSNSAFYKGKLYVSPNIRRPEDAPIEYINVKGTIERRGETSKGNRAEAKKVVELIKEILSGNIGNHGSIGVITFNTTQRDLIYSVLEDATGPKGDQEFAKLVEADKHRIDGGENRSMFIQSIENVQGDERDIIIFSVGYAPDADGKMSQRYGWLNLQGGENRLNVAITRAKQKIYVVTSLEPDEFKYNNTSGNGPKLFCNYLKYCKAVSNRDDEAVKSLLASIGELPKSEVIEDKVAIQKEIAEYLEKNGVKTVMNVGVSGYNIDLAVVGSNGYTLGIELDLSLYTKFGSTRERDLHRAKYLESRGWKVCRFWTPNYWSDKNKELERILKIAKSTL